MAYVVICDAFREPDRHYQLLPGGRSKRVETRRPSMRFLASAKAVKGGIAGVVGKEAQLFDDLSASAAELNDFVNQRRSRAATGSTRPARPISSGPRPQRRRACTPSALPCPEGPERRPG